MTAGENCVDCQNLRCYVSKSDVGDWRKVLNVRDFAENSKITQDKSLARDLLIVGCVRGGSRTVNTKEN